MTNVEFQSLQLHSGLPDWLRNEAELSTYWLLEMGGTHGDESDQVEVVRAHQQEDLGALGILPIIANKLAADRGIRYITDEEQSEQLMAYYPGDFHGHSNQDRTAAGITWLVNSLRDNHLVIDRHSSALGERYAAFGHITTPEAIAAGYVMGHDIGHIYRLAPFSRVIPESVSIEEAMPRDAEGRESYFKDTLEQLQLVAELGYAGLTALYYAEQLAERIIFSEMVTEIY